MKKILFALSLLISFSAFAENKIDLTTQVKGVLPVANGGINQAAVAITGGSITISNMSLGAPLQSGSIGYTSFNGTQIWPKTGSAFDAALVNSTNSAYVWKVPTGTNNITFDGTISGNGTGLTGTAAGLSIGGTAAMATTATTATNQSGGTVAATTANASTSYSLNGNLLASATAPTITGGFGTSPSMTMVNGTSTFGVQIGSGGTSFNGTFTMPPAPNGWSCMVNQQNGYQPNSITKQNGGTTTQVSISNYSISTGASLAWIANSIYELNCIAF